METFTADIAGGLAEDIRAPAIAESDVDAVIEAVRSNSDLNSKTSPIADSAALVHLDREMDVVAVDREIFSNIPARRMAAVRQHNTMLPINKLPAELLAHVILIVVHSQPWSLGTLASLASVCSRWWRIIITTPSLWTTARIFHRPDLALKKSKELPVTVRLQDWPHSDEQTKQFMEVVGPHSHRWQYVFIQTSFPLVLSQLARPLPQLEGLSLGYYGGWRGSSKHLGLGFSPKLRHLSLSRITLNWRALTQISLETLSLRDLRQNNVPRLRELYQLLASSPNLTSLTLCDLEEVVDAQEFQAEPLLLTRLRTINVSNIGERTTVGLTNLLRAENLHELSILAQIHWFSKVPDFQTLLRLPQGSSLLSSAIRNQGWKVIRATIWPTNLGLTNRICVGGATTASLNLGIQGLPGFQLLLLLGAHDRGYDIDLDITHSDLKGEVLYQVLHVIDPLVLRIGLDHIAPTLMALSTMPPPSEKWFCPNLQEIHLMTTQLALNTIANTLGMRNGSMETGQLPGRSMLSVYNQAGEVFSTKTGSFIPKVV